MDLRRTARSALATALVVALAAPAGALAAKGDGPYTPFPDEPRDRALNYLDKLNQRHRGAASKAGARPVTPAALARGVRVPQGDLDARVPRSVRADPERGTSRPDADSASPFARAGVDEASPPPDPKVAPFLALGAGLALAALAVGVYRRRRPWAS